MDQYFSSSVPSSSSLFPMESSPLEISDEAFNLFHSIDRELYTRLVHTLGRDPSESSQVMAFWMWLEKESKDMAFIKRLLSLPPLPHLNALSEETIVCLRCIDTDIFPYGGAHEVTLSLLPEIVNDRINHAISLRLFHENRVAISRAVARILNTVCARAFRDIPPLPVIGQPLMYHFNLPFAPAAPAPVAPDHLLAAAQQHHEMVMSMNNQRFEEISININNIIDDGEVLPDDRTVFLTFSKGYPISEDEVTEFFTRRFGDFIEDLIMQDVGDEEQVLYARMVARSTALIDEIVGGNKAKYVINGKHVWARKYVKKHHQFLPPRTTARSCQEPSSSATATVAASAHHLPSSSNTMNGEQS